jgi:hypothetical protein
MGFDLSGIGAKNKKGEYFRNNCWWWRPLWNFCCYLVPEIDPNKGQFNDGKTIRGKQHKKLVANLKNAIENKDEFAEVIFQMKKGYILSNQYFRLKSPFTKGKSGLNTEEKEELACDDNENFFPFSWENVEEFYEFVSNNSGFAIC